VRRILAFLTGLTFAACLVVPASVTAHNDRQTPFPAAPFDLDTTFCDFPVHGDVLLGAEYGRSVPTPDGSAIFVTGPVHLRVTNMVNGESVRVNASGPGTITFLSDGVTIAFDASGRTLLFAPNLTDWGYPSNIVALAGPVSLTQVVAADGTFTFTAMSGTPHLLMDVCAALS